MAFSYVQHATKTNPTRASAISSVPVVVTGFVMGCWGGGAAGEIRCTDNIGNASYTQRIMPDTPEKSD